MSKSGACGPPPPRPKPWPGRICNMLAPRLEICSATAAVAPLPRVTIVTTAATPMTMPSTVRNERNLCLLISRTARMTVVKNMTASRHPGEGRGLVGRGRDFPTRDPGLRRDDDRGCDGRCLPPCHPDEGQDP